MKQGFFVTFEGIEGCGKTTQLKLAARWLEAQGANVLLTREPGGTPIGEQIRRILLSESSMGLSPLAEALLYMADRFQHINDVIRPGLTENAWVLSDRFHDSTVAYQGYARSISMQLLDSIWQESGQSIEPDLTFLFDLDPAIGLQRSLRKLQAQKLDEARFEKESLEFHARVRDGFLQLARKYPERFHVLDAARSIDTVHLQVTDVIKERFGTVR